MLERMIRSSVGCFTHHPRRRSGPGPRGFLATLSQYMLSSAATFSFFLAIGSVRALLSYPLSGLIDYPKSRSSEVTRLSRHILKPRIFSSCHPSSEVERRERPFSRRGGRQRKIVVVNHKNAPPSHLVFFIKYMRYLYSYSTWLPNCERESKESTWVVTGHAAHTIDGTTCAWTVSVSSVP